MKGTNLAIIFVLIFTLFGARLILKAHKYAEEIRNEKQEQLDKQVKTVYKQLPVIPFANEQ